MKKVIFTTIIAILILLISSAVFSQEKKGNTAGNLANEGLFAENAEWIYFCPIGKLYSLWDDTFENALDRAANEEYLYKIRKDGTGRTKLCNDKAKCINVVDEWVYYTNENDSSNIYKIRTDGTNRTKINNEPSFAVNVVDNWIYYFCSSGIYKIRIDGTGRTKIVNDALSYPHAMCIDNGWIYYTSYSVDDYSHYLYKIRIDGTGRTKLTTDNDISYIHVFDNWIYYKNYYGISAIKIDGTNKREIMDDVYYAINIVDGWIYYMTSEFDEYYDYYDDEYTYTSYDNLYKVKTNGTQKTKLLTGNFSFSEGEYYLYSWINIIGNYVYYVDHDDDENIYMIKTDGTDRSRFEVPTRKHPKPKFTEPPYYSVVKHDDLTLKWSYINGDADHYCLRVKDITDDKIIFSDSKIINNSIILKKDWLQSGHMYEAMLIASYKNIETACDTLKFSISNIANNKTLSINSEAQKVGNTNGNITNIAYYSGENNWMYYVLGDTAIYKIKYDGTGRSRILTGYQNISSLNIVDGWIYYKTSYYTSYIKKIKIDGSEETTLTDDKAWWMIVVGEWIYYCNASDNCYIYKIAIDGTKREKLNNESSAFLNFADGLLYYIDTDDGNKIYSLGTNGLQRNKITDDNCSYINVSNGWIYYQNNSDRGYLYKIRTNGTGKTKLNSDNSQFINVAGNTIYYSNGTSGDMLYKMNIDGTGKTKLNSYKTRNINILDEWIYYTKMIYEDDEYANEEWWWGENWKIHSNGTSNVKLNIPDFPIFISPTNNSTLTYGDITIKWQKVEPTVSRYRIIVFDDDEYAYYYEDYLYMKTTNATSITIPAKTFNKGRKYQIQIIAEYDEYGKYDEPWNANDANSISITIK